MNVIVLNTAFAALNAWLFANRKTNLGYLNLVLSSYCAFIVVEQVIAYV